MLPLLAQQQIDGLVPGQVPALHERGASAEVEDRPRGVREITRGLDRQTREDACFMEVARAASAKSPGVLLHGGLGSPRRPAG